MKTITLIFVLLTLSVKGQTIDLGSGNFSVYSSNSNGFDRVWGTVIFSTINASMNTMNYISLKRNKEKSNAGFGIITGVTQLSYGAFYEREEGLKAVNISFGLATVVFSTICLLKKEKNRKEKKLSLALSSSQAPYIDKINGASLVLKF